MSVRLAPALALLLAVPLLPSAGLAEDSPSFVLNTDTPVYCAQLARQVADRHSQIMDVQRLLEEGREMCERGEVRGGIRRLRRALVMLHHRLPRDEPAF